MCGKGSVFVLRPLNQVVKAEPQMSQPCFPANWRFVVSTTLRKARGLDGSLGHVDSSEHPIDSKVSDSPFARGGRGRNTEEKSILERN